MSERVQNGGLNDAQRRAVEWDEGPLIVLAGPGTGKTRVITRRVAHLISEKHAAPESIVAATFTVKAAEELRRRVGELCGGDVAERVQAGTLHGLGYRIVRRFGDMIGLKQPRGEDGGAGGPVIMDTAQKKRLLRSLIGEGGLYGWLAAPVREEMVGQAGWHISRFGEHAREPEDVAAFAERWGANLARGVGSGGAALDEASLATQREEQRVFAETARLYALYERACRDKGWMSHDDLILLAVRVLKRSARAAAVARDEIRHVVVDEFQDVNAAQIELLRALCPPESRGGRPDLVVVGDDDQAIYAFRGADDRAFSRFAQIWPRHGEVRLEENYRSASRVVGLYGEVIGRATRRFAPDKRVIAADKDRGDGLVQCVDLDDNHEDVEAALALMLHDRAAAGGVARAWRSYAVICRANADVERVGEFLRLEGVPVRVTRRTAPSEDDGVKDLLSWVELLADPEAVWAAARLVRRAPALVPAALLWEWEHAWRARRPEKGERGAGAAYLAFIAARAAEQSGAGAAEVAPRVERLRAMHAELAQAATTLDAAAMVERIIGAADLAHADLLPRRERARRVSSLLAVLAFARSRTPLLDPPRDIRALWSYYNDLETEDERGFRTKWDRGIDLDEEESAEGEPDGDDARPDAVQVLTAHAAKGLEFDTVFVPKVQPTGGYGKAKRDDRALPPGFIEDPADGGPATGAPAPPPGSVERQREEERRILYVACSRAERRLVLMSKKQKSASSVTHFYQELTRGRVSPWVDEVVDIGGVRARAVGAGVSMSAGRAVPALGAGGATKREVVDGLASTSRLLAAEAFETLLAAADADVQRRAAERLREAGDAAKVVAEFEATDRVPEWAERLAPGTEGARAAAVLGRFLRREREMGAPATGLVFRPPAPPLKLSYSTISAYIECPRCYYMKSVAGVGERSSTHQALGNAVHAALKAFYERWGRADAEGARPDARPGVDELVRLGDAALVEEWTRATGEPPDRLTRDGAAAQLRGLWERLHSDADHIEELEAWMPFTYQRGGHAHIINAKIDRLDRDPATRAVRLIDYKTGKAKPELTTPKPEDLQLGMYVLALEAGRGAPDERGRMPDAATLAAPTLRGTAEYWVLSTGQRGVIDLAQIDLGATRAKIDLAIDGILAGKFEPAKKCKNCTFLGEE